VMIVGQGADVEASTSAFSSPFTGTKQLKHHADRLRKLKPPESLAALAPRSVTVCPRRAQSSPI
ncbi:MAG: hypothetical protein WA813_06215, partial [Beijerinckiaceae bacterium]